MADGRLITAPDAERSVIGSMMLDATCLRRLDVLSDDDFAIYANRLIIRAIRALEARGDSIDLITITNEMDTRGTLAEVGGVLYLTELSRYVPTTANIDSYVKIVKDTSGKRAVRRKCSELDQMVEDGHDLSEIVAECERWLSGMKRGMPVMEDESITASLLRVWANLEQRAKGEGLGTLTGITEFDAMTGGIHGNEVTVIAGRPGAGKTALALYIARMFAKEGKPVQIFSREMSTDDLTMRVLAAESRVSMSRMRTGGMTDADFEAGADGMERIFAYKGPIWIDENAPSPAAIRAKCRYRAEADGLGLIVIDYLQLLTGDGRYSTTNERITAISWAIRDMAIEFKTPVILISQLNRSSEQESRKPKLSDLRDSGSIEQDANNVAILWQPVNDVDANLLRYLATDEKQFVRLELLKQKNGPVGYADMVFDKPHMNFEDIPEYFRKGD